MFSINHDLNTWPLEIIDNIIKQAPLYEQGSVISRISKKFEHANTAYREGAQNIFLEIKKNYPGFQTKFTTEQRIQLFSSIGKNNLLNELHNLENNFLSDFFHINWNSDDSENLKINNHFGNLRIKCFFSTQMSSYDVCSYGGYFLYTGSGFEPKISYTSHVKFTQRKIGFNSWLPVSNTVKSHIVNTAFNVDLQQAINMIAKENIKYLSHIKTLDDVLDGISFFCDSKGRFTPLKDSSTLYNFYLMVEKEYIHPFLRWTTDKYKRTNYSPSLQEALRNSALSKTTELLAKQLKIYNLYNNNKS